MGVGILSWFINFAAQKYFSRTGFIISQFSNQFHNIFLKQIKLIISKFSKMRSGLKRDKVSVVVEKTTTNNFLYLKKMDSNDILHLIITLYWITSHKFTYYLWNENIDAKMYFIKCTALKNPFNKPTCYFYTYKRWQSQFH